MKKVFVIILLMFLSGCSNNLDEPNWDNYEESDYTLLLEENEYRIYERVEYIPTPLSRLDYFSDTCSTVVDMPDAHNYLLFYDGEFHTLIKGIEENLFNGEDLVELGVEGIHCD